MSVDARIEEMAYEPKPAEVSRFENEKAGHERAPDHRGYIVAHRDIKAGERIAIALWKGNSDSHRSFRGIATDMAKAGVAEVERDLFGRPLAVQPQGRT